MEGLAHWLLAARSCLMGADEVVKKAFDAVGAANVARLKLVAARKQLLLAIEGAAIVVYIHLCVYNWLVEDLLLWGCCFTQASHVLFGQ